MHVYLALFLAKSLPTCVNYDVHQMAKDNAKDGNLVNGVQQNFYTDDFLKSVRTLQEAIVIYQKLKTSSTKVGSI